MTLYFPKLTLYKGDTVIFGSEAWHIVEYSVNGGDTHLVAVWENGEARGREEKHVDEFHQMSIENRNVSIIRGPT